MKEFLRARRVLILTWLTGLILLLQVFNLHSYVVSAVDHQAVVAATDDDASWNIAKTVKTRWWKDNGWVLYGPFYFRLNHSIQYFWERTANPSEVGPTEAWERTAHHSILTVSLLSLVGVSLMIGAALFELWWIRFLFAFAMNAAFLSNPSRAEFILRAHPDHLFTLFVVAGLWLTALMFFKPGETIWRKLSACVWGLSVSVKMTLGICAPGFLLLFVPPFRRRENWISGLRYLGVMLLAYFLIGFPQTIVLGRPFRDLAMMNGLSVRADGPALLHWLAVFWAQAWGPLVVLLLACIFLGRKREWPALSSSWLRLGAFVVIPFLMLAKSKMLVPADHYPIPFVAMLILFLAFLATKIPAIRLPERWSVVSAVAFFSLTMAIWGSTPQAMQTALVKNLQCREQARSAYQEILKLYKAGENIWVDPYVPYYTAGEKSRIDLSWEKTWKEFSSSHWTVVAINEGYRNRFVSGNEPSPYDKVEHPNWKDIREFYLPFGESETAHSPNGDLFKRVYKNSCGQTIWKVQK